MKRGPRALGVLASAAALSWAAACTDDSTAPDPNAFVPTVTPATMSVTGLGPIANRFTAEVWAVGNTAYTTTWGSRGNPQAVGNAINIWDVGGASPVLVDSVIVTTDAQTIGDVQVTDDGALLVVPTELAPGSIIIYSLADPRRPQQLARFTSPDIVNGVHTCVVQRVGGVLYAFLSANRSSTTPSRLVIVNLSVPSAPVQVLSRDMGTPFIHDVFVRDGFLFTALWTDGVTIWDIGGGTAGGSAANPVQIGNVRTAGGKAHNVWWYHDGRTASRKFMFVGEEGSGSLGASASGDLHVVDISDMTQPREVAALTVPGAGAHNFSADESRGILYAAFYNGGVQALDVRGDLGTCPDSAKRIDGRCDLARSGRVLARGLLDRPAPVYIWGVQVVGPNVYASDMLNGLWKLGAFIR